MSDFYNPYNFVRWLPDRKLGEAEDETALLGRCPPPPRDRASGLSGTIECQIEALTPLFVPDAEDVTLQGEHPTYRFLEIDGARVIPGSSFRGAVRSVFEAVTNSCYAIFDGDFVVRRPQTGEALTYVPGVVEGDASTGWGVRLLPGHMAAINPDQEKSHPTPAAWIARQGLWTGNPTAPDAYYQRPASELLEAIIDEGPCWGVLGVARIWRKAFEFHHVYALLPRQPSETEARARLRFSAQGVTITPGQHEVREGWARLTGPTALNKHDDRFFYDAGSAPGARLRDLDPAVVEKYNKLIRNYQAEHEDEPSPRNAPGLVFSPFVKARPLPEIREGRLVYVRLKQNGEVDYLAPVALPRLLTRRSRKELLPEHVRPCGASSAPAPHTLPALCPACRVFGWVHPDAERLGKRGSTIAAVRGRVRFSHGQQVGEAEPIGDWPLAILSTPKPSASYFYVRPEQGRPRDGISPEVYSYDNAGYVLRGRKFYRRPNADNFFTWKEYRPLFEGNQPLQTNQNRTARNLLAPGARFSFRVQFDDLQPLELGALLFALHPFSDEGALRLGYGKPLGLGVVKTTLQHVQVWEAAAAYRPNVSAGESDPEVFLERFRAAMAQAYGAA
ncbi:MAG: TIGR03986 family type III CRISPR-associated RAMP protein, partial [Dehalococcoidia bacterium]